jgi:hypothetical protein
MSTKHADLFFTMNQEDSRQTWRPHQNMAQLWSLNSVRAHYFGAPFSCHRL